MGSYTQQEVEQEYAVKLYKEQKNAILGIRNTLGFKEIIKYFEREIEGAKDLLTKCTIEDLPSIQARYGYANGFLTFLKDRSDS